MCISVVSVRNATKALLPRGVPDLKLHLDAVDRNYLVLQQRTLVVLKCLK